jgi:DNA-binding NarL/FixJ family response regulator
VSGHPALRAGLAHVIAREPGLGAEIADSLSAATAAFARVHPDVVLIDAPLAEGDAFEACHALKQLAAPRRVALYSDRIRDELHLAAWLAGADALIDKAAPVETLVEQLRLVARGGRVLRTPSVGTLTAGLRGVNAADRTVFGMCVYGVELGEISRTLRRDPLEVESTVRTLIRRLAQSSQ